MCKPLNSKCIQQSLKRVFLAVQDFGLYITLSLPSSALKTVICGFLKRLLCCGSS